MTSLNGHCYDIACWKGEEIKVYEIPHDDILMHIVARILEPMYDKIIVYPRWATNKNKKH